MLDLSDDFDQNTDSNEKILNSFIKYWEARALVNAYSEKVDTQILYQGKDIKDKSQKQFQRKK